MARAIIHQPAAFLMDEPLSNLDAKLRIKTRAEMQRLHRQLRTTTLYVTHDQEEALAIGDAVAVLDHGRLQQFGTPDEIFERPANVFVASFIGAPEMNLLRGQIVSEAGSLAFRGHGVQFSIPESIGQGLGELAGREQPVLIGARSEDVSIVAAHTSGAFPGKVDVVERIGRDIHAHVAIDGSVIRVITTAEMQLSPQQSVWLAFDQQRVHVFDATTGARVELPG